MTEERFNAGNFSARVLRCNTAIVGTGAAGYNAADRLWQYGRQDILLITEKRTAGTSRNTGSDKQTYYKLTLSGGDPDSVREMAETLFDGQCVDGDIALCEAALSTQGFLKLAELGVPFPRNRYGEYIGYKTDHDPRRRATSVGPYTSKQMTEKLEAAVTAKGVPMLDNTQVIKIVCDGTRRRSRRKTAICWFGAKTWCTPPAAPPVSTPTAYIPPASSARRVWRWRPVSRARI